MTLINELSFAEPIIINDEIVVVAPMRSNGKKQ